jgi:Zn-dependent protease with chaperone function/uncharacterized tellurite resistance protein B-like protein
MDFFDRQDRARRRTKVLVFYFGLALVLTVLALYAVFALIFLHERAGGGNLARLWDPALFAGVALGTMFIVFLGSVAKIMELSRGGAAVATMLGGTPVRPDTTDPHERKLLNVVEEMALASGVPVPQVFLLREEEGINAFAAGLATRDAAVGVTRGGMRLLTRDELQGVIAHEFSHILNGDMRLNLRLIGIINGLLVLTIIGRQLLRVRGGRSRGGKDSNPLPLIGLALLVIGGIGMLFARLIKSAVSRQREYLADAAAVQFTRNPAGLAGALKKIGGLAAGSRLQTPHAEQASHLFFSNGLRESWLAMFSTHPPLAERIRALDPQFDGRFPRLVAEAPAEAPTSRRWTEAGPPRLAGVAAGLAGAEAPPPAPRPARLVPAHAALADAGHPAPEHLAYAEALRARLPAELVAAAREPLGAAGLVLSLVLSRDPATRQQQLDSIEATIHEQFFAGLPSIAAAVENLAERDRLPLVMLALPALRELSPSQYEAFAGLLQQLVESDEAIDLFEYALQRLVRRHLAPHFEQRPVGQVAQYYALQPLLGDCAVLLSALAHLGNKEAPNAAAAFAQGATRLGTAGPALRLLPLAECNLAQVEAALDRLALASPAIRRQALQACADAVAADGELHVREAELLRAIADALDCPLPPFLESV